MSSGATLNKRYRLLSTANFVVALCLAITMGVLAGNIAAKNASDRLMQDAGETLAVQTETLNGLLDRYALTASLLSNRPDIAALLTANDAMAAADLTRRIAGYSGAKDIYLLRPDGTIVSSGIGLFRDQIPADSELLSAPRQGRLGRGVRLLENGSLAYVFTRAIRAGGNFIGIVAVYAGLDEIQAAWSLSKNPIVASSENGLVIISNRYDWRQKPLGSIRKLNNGKIQIDTPQGTRPFVEASQTLPLLGWTLSVLTDATPVAAARSFWVALTAIAIMSLAWVSQTLINRQHETRKRERSDRATALRLERLVRDRTRELSTSNTSLTHEIEVRRLAEEQLRKTQSELIQTGKLAALGQMSTALSHEYNQPLAAIKSYAENARTYLDRDRPQEARENITLISQLTDRMAEISSHLRNFARKPNLDFGAISVSDVVQDALLVTAPRLRAENAEILVTNEDNLPQVRAGHVRLQQVLVNLILNALDAAKDKDQPRITIHTSASRSKVKITVTDNGTGISAENMQNVFDPFFTTKPVGQGLGLGLSISYNIVKDFGGQLAVSNAKTGGAEFTIILQAAKNPMAKTTPAEAAQ